MPRGMPNSPPLGFLIGDDVLRFETKQNKNFKQLNLFQQLPRTAGLGWGGCRRQPKEPRPNNTLFCVQFLLLWKQCPLELLALHCSTNGLQCTKKQNKTHHPKSQHCLGSQKVVQW